MLEFEREATSAEAESKRGQATVAGSRFSVYVIRQKEEKIFEKIFTVLLNYTLRKNTKQLAKSFPMTKICPSRL